jgi:hypothetical protein
MTTTPPQLTFGPGKIPYPLHLCKTPTGKLHLTQLKEELTLCGIEHLGPIPTPQAKLEDPVDLDYKLEDVKPTKLCQRCYQITKRKHPSHII